MKPSGIEHLLTNKGDLYQLNNVFFTGLRKASAEYFSVLEASVGMAIEKVATDPEKLKAVIDKLNQVQESLTKLGEKGEHPLKVLNRVVLDKMGLPDTTQLSPQKLATACMIIAMQPDSDPLFKLLDSLVESLSDLIDDMKDIKTFHKKQIDIVTEKYKTEMDSTTKRVDEFIIQLTGLQSMGQSVLSMFKNRPFNNS